MAVLDDLSGFEFEDVIEDVFRNLGYENVRQATKTADEGRDILMEEVVDGRAGLSSSSASTPIQSVDRSSRNSTRRLRRSILMAQNAVWS